MIQSILRISSSIVCAVAGGALCSFYWSGDDAGSWTPWWEVIVWLLLTLAGIVAGCCCRFPLSALLSFSIPMFGMVPVAVVVHVLKKRHPEE